MRWRGAGLLLVAVLASSALSCASLFERPATEEERRAYARASHAAAAAGTEADARSAYEGFLERFPNSALASDAALALAELAHREGDLQEARRRYEQAARGSGDAADRARVQLALLDIERGDAAEARRRLERVRLSRLDDSDLRNAYRVFAETSDGAERVQWLALLRAKLADPADVAAVDDQIDALLAELSTDELRAAARRVRDRPPIGRIQLFIAERELQAGDVEAAREALDEAGRHPIAPRHAERFAAMETRLRGLEVGEGEVSELRSFAEAAIRPLPPTAAARGALGVIVPLTGPFARFGEEVLEGVLLAAGTFSDAEPGHRPEVRVVVRDSAGDPGRAGEAVRALARDPEVVAIIGPLVSASCEAAAAAAEEEGVSLLALTSREDVARTREWVFRVRTRPVEEAELLADRAVASGAERFAILYPNDPYGLGLRALFWDAVERRGGSVVAVASFDPSATDFGEPIRRLVGYTLLDDEQKHLIARREGMLAKARRLSPSEGRALRKAARSLTTRDGGPIPPIVDFDALFLPASKDNLVLIAPQLAFHDVTGARLLGTDGGFDAELLRLTGEHLEGAMFASHFHSGSEVPYVAAFRGGFEAAFGAAPGAFAAQGYDAASLVLVQLAAGETARDEVRDGVLRTASFPGVSGILSMRPDGNAQKRPFLIGIEEGKVVEYAD